MRGDANTVVYLYEEANREVATPVYRVAMDRAPPRAQTGLVRAEKHAALSLGADRIPLLFRTTHAPSGPAEWKKKKKERLHREAEKKKMARKRRQWPLGSIGRNVAVAAAIWGPSVNLAWVHS